jgi:hypothetical protein
LLTCSNPFSLKDALETEVKIAKDMFLKIELVSPALNETDVNPGLPMTVVFDRDLDESTIAEAIVSIEPTGDITDLSFTYTATTKTLEIRAIPALNNGIQHTITLTKALKGADGSELQEPHVWGFTTGTYPAGTVFINANAVATNDVDIELNLDWNDAVDQFRYSFISEQDMEDNSPWIGTTTQTYIPPPLSGTDGLRTVWVEFRDQNTPAVHSLVQTDSIFLDRASPVVNSFLINSGAASTTSTRVTLSIDVTDTSPLQMRLQNGMTAGGTWQAYSATRLWTLAANVGTRAVTAEFMDLAGNTTTIARDYIIYGTPTVTAASLGSAAVGAVTVNLAAGTEDAGTDYYYIYRRDYPNGEILTYLANGTAYAVTVPVTEGSFYYFHAAIYNSNCGTGSTSSTYALGYTANVAIIYDSADTTDTAIANEMLSILTTDLPNHATYGSSIDGTMPSWSVILIPQSMVSSTYSAANILYGDPLIITPRADIFSNANQVRNVTAHGRGVIAMGTGGTRALDTVNSNFSAWGYGGQQPSSLGYSGAYVGSASIHGYTWTSGNTVWYSPLTSTGFLDVSPADGYPDHNAYTQLAYPGREMQRIIRYKSDDLNDGTVDYFLYARDNYTHYFTVVRQGRFLHYGYEHVPNRPFTGWVQLVNLVSRMATF